MEAHVNILTKLPQLKKLEANQTPLLTKTPKKAIMYRSRLRKNLSDLGLIETIYLPIKSTLCTLLQRKGKTENH